MSTQFSTMINEPAASGSDVNTACFILSAYELYCITSICEALDFSCSVSSSGSFHHLALAVLLPRDILHGRDRTGRDIFTPFLQPISCSWI